ncbi:helix-turn-helix transcriptional regulator [Kitasatospora aureofaciens]|uniref:helix-turn-helix domain-containing protein n=1 Tax=Kitasatospora aureofaciens TaxID=1894 RepID=UPI001C44FACA|nr:helix-turn-helix transcriptional regulator [Kitasatospora aureofaciens]MBV6700290.1 helix-turn-helix transcriptional regulator [Kitasatospora aureofaciens]
MAPTSPPTFRRRRLGMALRRLREAQGRTQFDVAAAIGVNIDRISRAELGRTKVDVPLLRVLLDEYAVTDQDLRQTLEDMTRNIGARGWWHSYNSFLTLGFQDFLGLEGEAALTREWENLVPGRLQTEEYTRLLLAAGQGIVHPTREQIESRVAVRMGRQMKLRRPYEVVLGEAAVLNHIGDAEAMKRQIVHLREQSERDDINLRILPLSCGPHLGLDGAFTLFTFPDGGQLVSLEALLNSFYLEDEDSLRIYNAAFGQIHELALDEKQTQAFLERAAHAA